VLVPLLEGGSLEEDESMAERWAALLANATDPDAPDVPPAFPDVLRQLSTDDARLLDHMVSAPAQSGRPAIPPTMIEHHVFGLLEAGPIRVKDRLLLALDNLLRLRLVGEETYEPPGPRVRFGDMTLDAELPISAGIATRLRVTTFGAAFAAACRADVDAVEQSSAES
jgi:hypothetical protein